MRISEFVQSLRSLAGSSARTLNANVRSLATIGWLAQRVFEDFERAGATGHITRNLVLNSSSRLESTSKSTYPSSSCLNGSAAGVATESLLVRLLRREENFQCGTATAREAKEFRTGARLGLIILAVLLEFTLRTIKDSFAARWGTQRLLPTISYLVPSRG